MIEETATVITYQNGLATVRCHSRSACGGCQQQSSCGVGVLNQVRPNQVHEFELKISALDEHKTIKVGQQVVVGLPENSLLKGASVVYILPLFGLFLGAGLGIWWQELHHLTHEIPTIIGAALGMFAGWFGVQLWGRKRSEMFEPRLVRILDETIPVQVMPTVTNEDPSVN